MVAVVRIMLPDRQWRVAQAGKGEKKKGFEGVAAVGVGIMLPDRQWCVAQTGKGEKRMGERQLRLQ